MHRKVSSTIVAKALFESSLFKKASCILAICTIAHNDKWFRETGLVLAVARKSTSFRLSLVRVATSFAATVTKAVRVIAHVATIVLAAKCTKAIGLVHHVVAQSRNFRLNLATPTTLNVVTVSANKRYR